MYLLRSQLLLFSFFTIGIIFSQSNSSGIIHYESTINSRKVKEYMTNKRDKIKNQGTREMLDKIFLSSKKVKSKLIFNDGMGFFKIEDKLNLDKNKLAQEINRTLAGGSTEYYYNAKSNSYLIKDCEAVGECFIFPNTFLEWELTQETKKVKDFLSYKATRSNGKIIAWYTPSIPVSFGPKGEYGLPGLILELEIGKIIFKATKIILNPKQVPKIEAPEEGQMVTKEEYKKIVKKAKKTIFGNK